MAVNSTSADGGGFRLRSLELFNWGTFHGKVFSLKANGRTSLLTGANGSGKTTLIDALLTLMVPSNKRFYNQSSGAEFKKERDENSYFWGHYGKTYSDTDERSKTEQLRHKSDNPYSVLLSCFQNSATRQTVTLVQVRWFSNNGLRKVYIVSPYQLNIDDHFGKGNFDMKGEWRRKLQKQFPKTDFFDTFKDYAGRFSDLFGLKEKALPLFNQTVGIKVLGDLTQFIRQQMLEEPNSEEQFLALHNHYTDLLISHKAIKKDERQLELLNPIMENKQSLEELGHHLLMLEAVKNESTGFFNNYEYDLLATYLTELDERIARFKLKKQEQESDISRLQAREREFISQRAQMNVDGQVQLLKKDIQNETEKKDLKKQHSEEYHRIAQSLGLHTDIDESTFNENLKASSLLHDRLQSEYEELTEEKSRYRIELETAKKDIQELQHEISSLEGRENRIPRELISVREQLTDLLEIGEDQLPFVGELIKVSDDSRHWEDVIERVLHSFAMRVLVPEQYIKKVNEFVHERNLRAKLVYERIEKRPGDRPIRWPTDDDALINKVEIKAPDLYKIWVERQLVERFNYHCTDDLEVFYGSPKAVTSNGLIRNINRHEKDDRPNMWNKSKYRLGWDNKELVQYLKEQQSSWELRCKNLGVKIGELQPRIESVSQRLPLVTLLTNKKSYAEIDWKSHAEQIQFLSRQIDELTKSNDKYQTIIEHLQKVEKALDKKRKENVDLTAEIVSSENDYEKKRQQLQVIDKDGVTSEGKTLIEQFLAAEALDERMANSLDELSTFKKDFYKVLDDKLASITKKVTNKQLETMKHVSSFVHPEASILTEFPDWSGDTLNIAASLESLNELEDLFKMIRNQRLVEHKKRFQEYMDRSMLDALTNFRAWLSNEEEKIKEVIDELNVPLRRITFNKNPDTYLQLEYKFAKGDQEIRGFKEQLSATIPNTLEFATQKDEAYRQAVFEKLKELITELQKEDAWRRKVTDVRNWLVFSAREYSVVDNAAGQYHDNTASYSGGQKAQFTYAILGAAISHQFGIYELGKQHRSLRFITVDEAFSKLDPEKSEFLMEFCEQLNLQLLVVTPLDKINIAEPFIHAVHFVEVKNKKYSNVYNLSMQEYEARKEEFEQLAKLDDHP